MRRIRQGVATEAYWASTVRERNEAGADAAALECHRIYELKHLAALIAGLLLMAGCGPKAITVGSRPFPAGRPVFSDASGKTLDALPAADGTIRLVFLEFPWCTACADVWRAVRIAAKPFPQGTVSVYRVLFDRETVLSPAGRQEVPPLRPTPLPEGDGPEDSVALKVTALTALPGEFRKEFRVSHGPVLLLLDAKGKVERRWIGFSAGISRELSSEIRKRSVVLSPRPPGT
ncbi:hypothetical protein [Candidatus Deferrimicrobium sp.]|uniref:hypothetical protein n=1 Tax=Candidatus Deferrimicrobium sp. TaxID=3060586 RepID=UPI00271C6A13|nr:hypothetical protein [Candidatus Deferrimicrobium sp.]MDO8738769.1 hypothetical protein [Candidatus Deferrimicrobium sp.]